MSSPKLTTLIPAYNAALTIERALASVWEQNWDDMEVIVVNDASTDDTLETVRRIAGDRVILIDLPKNLGECGAMNAGLRRARGEFVAFLDADDEWLPGKLAKQMPVIEANRAMTFISGGGEVVLADGTLESVFGEELPDYQGKEFWRGLLRVSVVAKPTVVARRDALLATGGFNEALRISGDQDMWIRLALAGEVGFVPEKIMRIWTNPTSLIHRFGRREAEFTLPMILRHLESQRDRLSRRDYREILARRLAQTGRNLYAIGDYWQGTMLVLRGTALGHEPVTNLAFLLSGSPLGRRLKRWVGLTPAASADAQPTEHAQRARSS